MRRFPAFAAALFLGGAAWAGDGWDGTWVGGDGGVQLIIAGDEAVGLFWNGDYVDALASAVAADGKTMIVRWGTGVKAVATLDEGKVGLMIRQDGKPDLALVLKPDR